MFGKRETLAAANSFQGLAIPHCRLKPIRLIDGPRLLTLVQFVQDQDQSTKAKSHSPAADVSGSPVCPACGKPMILRTARRGAGEGEVSADGWTGYTVSEAVRLRREWQRHLPLVRAPMHRDCYAKAAGFVVVLLIRIAGELYDILVRTILPPHEPHEIPVRAILPHPSPLPLGEGEWKRR